MEVIFEDDKIINYKGIVDGKKFEVIFNKSNGMMILKIGSNVLNDSDFKLLFGKIYKNAISNVSNCKDVNFKFFPTDEVEFENANSIIADYMIASKSSVSSINIQRNRAIVDYFKTNMITKNENGHIINYVERKADANSSGFVLENINVEDMKDELEKIVMENEIDIETLSEEEIACLVLDRIALQRKQYFFDSAYEHSARDEKQQATLNATKDDDKVNMEVGLVKKDAYDNSFNSYRAVEQDGDNYKVVNPTVNEVSSVNTLNANDEVELGVNEIENRQEENIYYIDNYTSDIYVQKGAEVTKIGNLKDGNYKINFENNNLVLNDKELGPIDDINNMGKTQIVSKPKVRTLEKNNNGNISFGVICLITGIIIVIGIIFIFVFSVIFV